MDKTWMTAKRTTRQYITGVEEFLQYCRSNCSDLNCVSCPCLKCGNIKHADIATLEDHLFINGIDKSYKIWEYHGEKRPNLEDLMTDNRDHFADAPFITQMVEDVEDEFIDDNPHNFQSLLEDAEKPLYHGCEKFTKLSILVRLFNLKAKYGNSDSFFNELLSLLKDMLPENNEMPSSLHMAKKSLRTLGLGYEKIHACPIDCILYRREFVNASECPICHESRWKKKTNSDEVYKDVPAKALWYVPIIPRLIRLFRNRDHAKNLTWHENERIKDGKMRHPADSPAWKHVNSMWPDFGNEPRNIRLGLSADGINPHSSLSSSYSCWPVVIVIYNLPPWLCFKRKFLLLSLLIPGPKQPGNDIDVYLAPLIDDLKLLWENGVKAFDGFNETEFTLKAALLWTINDFPAYGNLSGCSVKGYLGCPVCGEDTISQRLKHGKKVVYMGHRRFLPLNHPYRRAKKAFNGNQEFRVASEPLSGVELAAKLDRMKFRPLGKIMKKRKDGESSVSSRKRQTRQPKETYDDGCWKKKSIFFQLEYWKHLLVRHTLDVMHIEKNICDSVIGTLMNIPGKSKDGINARLDLEDIGIRRELATIREGSRTYLPPACFTLTRDEKRKFCKILSEIKVPDGYSANISNYASEDELKLSSLKSHDCHILMQHFLPVAVETILPEGVRNAITRLCMFFNIICSKVLDSSKLDALQNDIVVTLCQLEQYFMPQFFDIMVHLTVHLVREIKLCGPTYMRWMYPFERFMKVLKGYVRNRFRPEGCIVENYIAEECVEFCSEYLQDLQAIGIPRSSSRDLNSSKGLNRGTLCTVNYEQLLLAHRNVLQNTDLVQPFIEEHLSLLKSTPKTKGQKKIHDEHHKTFYQWFCDRIAAEVKGVGNKVHDTLRWLSVVPSTQVIKHVGYTINGYHFTTKERDTGKTTQNSGVSLVAKTMQFSSAKDQRPVCSDILYYGVIKEIWELDYISFRVPLFLCDWVESKNGVKTDKNGFTMVDFAKLGHKEEPFILASQAIQVFYVKGANEWSYVFSTQPKDYFTEVHSDDDVELLVAHLTPLKGLTSNVGNPTNIPDENNNVYLRENIDGIWIDKE